MSLSESLRPRKIHFLWCYSVSSRISNSVKVTGKKYLLDEDQQGDSGGDSDGSREGDRHRRRQAALPGGPRRQQYSLQDWVAE
jgi:hypothetical protein